MRTIQAKDIEQAVCELCIKANYQLPEDLEEMVRASCGQEPQELANSLLQDLCDNLDAAASLHLPICQDTGMAVVFITLGQDVHIAGGSLREAVNRGVARGYTEGLLRCSVVADPLRRVNTGDNTPAVLHIDMVEGDGCHILVAPKGFGSENMSRVYMLTPAADRQTIIDCVVETARLAGGKACPPMVLGVGLGGTFEMCTLLAKKALCRPVSSKHPDPYYAALEEDCLEAVNRTGIGPQGLGGRTTAYRVAIETYPTHIAGLPLAVNVGCHVTRHAEMDL